MRDHNATPRRQLSGSKYAVCSQVASMLSDRSLSPAPSPPPPLSDPLAFLGRFFIVVYFLGHILWMQATFLSPISAQPRTGCRSSKDSPAVLPLQVLTVGAHDLTVDDALVGFERGPLGTGEQDEPKRRDSLHDANRLARSSVSLFQVVRVRVSHTRTAHGAHQKKKKR